MSVPVETLPSSPCLLRLRNPESGARLALWQEGALHDLSAAGDPRLHTLDRLLSLPVREIQTLLEGPEMRRLPALDPEQWDLLAPAESQEVWAAGVTYQRSREARMEEAVARDIYALVYEAERPEIFFKAAGWRVVPSGGAVGVRSDSSWDVPEPELAVLSNAHGEVVAYACGNDMSSRSIEGENPLYLPQAKVYDASCSLGPAAVLAWGASPRQAEIRMRVERDGQEVFAGTASVAEMVREPDHLIGVLHAVYPLPAGAWLLTGTSLVPAPPYTARHGDRITITVEGLGELRNVVKTIQHSGASAPPRLANP